MKTSKAAWRLPVFLGLVGVFLTGSAVLLRFAYPTWPIGMCLALGAAGVALVSVYLRSGVRDRQANSPTALLPELSERLKKQKWISVLLVLGLFAIFGLAGFAAIARRLFDPGAYHIVLGGCAAALLFWCVGAGIGHWMRQRVLDQSEIEKTLSADFD